ncbi:aldehyde dehydrogenase family protein [Tessaracoccus sp. MC1756]|uniref:aldehyde dehydrogenase family protein n=1 Tax=Tessaracoccus sp. MC1756 TaxID=2760311 RepID=UPI0016043B6D|nr:aldehyde dehydrogenase family protein [Tessaracoccus sp. MC1756]MBB1510944.1 aldehyde dehydrogenase family protein [Tessaracoccus sp. MC1756]
MAIASINPTTGELEREFDQHTEDQVEERIAAAHAAYRSLTTTTFAERARWMHDAADLLDEENEQVARMIVAEMGKPIAQARAEAKKSAVSMRFYADNAEKFLTGREIDNPETMGASGAYTRYEAMGVVLAVMPWNYPIWQVMRFAAPALMAGNTVLLKHASNVPQSALYMESLFERTGFPTGSFRSLLVPARSVEAIIRDPRVVAVTLTGSEPAGRSVASIAGSEVKHAVLELGGSDPFIVMPSADIEKAAQTAVTARLTNNGQACINAKRFIVHQDIYDQFVERFTDLMAGAKVGDPMEEDTVIGPLATRSGVEDLHELVTDAAQKGAQILTGGSPQEGGGYFYPPTVLAGVTPEMRLYKEEAFGPAAAVYRAADRDEALEIANATTFGLSSAVWTADDDDVDFFVRNLVVGAVFVNGMSVSYPELPFGGTKDSGIGRELSAEGIREFCNLKSVWVG